MNPPPIGAREQTRNDRFKEIWSQELDMIFADVAPVYDRANYVASLGLWGWFISRFIATVTLKPHQRVLDVCAGTNSVGIALLKREPTLDVHAIDRSVDMQRVGQQRVRAKDLHIHSTIGDAHKLPFPDNHFDIVTLQFASRHLRLGEAFQEIRRILKPGGHFHHCDMLRPPNPVIEKLYYSYLRFCLHFTGLFYGGKPSLNAKKYFMDALEIFYSADELSIILRELGFVEVSHKTIFAGMLGFHKATKA